MDIVSCYLVVAGDRAGPMMIDDAKVLGLSTLSTLILRFFYPLIVSFCICGAISMADFILSSYLRNITPA